jgi:glutathione S-transferase
MITVHHLGVSQSERAVWLCEELAIPYQLRRYDRDPTTHLAPADYKALHPMGIAPVITDGALVLAESGAILEYVIAKYGNGRLAVRPDQPNFADYLFWFHFANGTMMPSEMGGVISSMLGLEEGNPIMTMLKDRSERAFSLVERRLGDVPYFAGNEFTAGRHHDVISAVDDASIRATRSFTAPAHQGIPKAHRRAAGLPARYDHG